MCIRNESVTNGQIIPHAVLWSNTSDFGFTSEIGGGFLFSNCVDKDGEENCGKPANDEGISFFYHGGVRTKIAFHSGYAWYMRTNGKAFSRKVLGRGNAILVPRSCVMPMFGLRGRVVVAYRRKNRTLQDNPHAFARGGDAAHTKKGRISLVDFSLLGKIENGDGRSTRGHFFGKDRNVKNSHF